MTPTSGEARDSARAVVAQSAQATRTARQRIARSQQLAHLSRQLVDNRQESGAARTRRSLTDPLGGKSPVVFPALEEDDELRRALGPEAETEALVLLHLVTHHWPRGPLQTPAPEVAVYYGTLLLDGLVYCEDRSRPERDLLLGPGDLLDRHILCERSPRVLAPVRAATLFEHAAILELDETPLRRARRQREQVTARRAVALARTRQTTSDQERIFRLLAMIAESWPAEPPRSPRRTPPGLTQEALATLARCPTGVVSRSLNTLVKEGRLQALAAGAFAIPVADKHPSGRPGRRS